MSPTAFSNIPRECLEALSMAGTLGQTCAKEKWMLTTIAWGITIDSNFVIALCICHISGLRETHHNYVSEYIYIYVHTYNVNLHIYIYIYVLIYVNILVYILMWAYPVGCHKNWPNRAARKISLCYIKRNEWQLCVSIYIYLSVHIMGTDIYICINICRYTFEDLDVGIPLRKMTWHEQREQKGK